MKMRRQSLRKIVASTMAAGLVAALVFAYHRTVLRAAADQDYDAEVEQTYYQVMAAQCVRDIYDLEQYFVDNQMYLLPVVPPGPTAFRQPGIPFALPFEAEGLPEKLLEGLLSDMVNGVTVYDLTIAEDPLTREIAFLNVENEVIFRLDPPEKYDPLAYLLEKHPALHSESYSQRRREELMSIYDPARIRILVRLVPIEDFAQYLYNTAQIEAAAPLVAQYEESLQEEDGGGGMSMMMSTTGVMEISAMVSWTNSMVLTITYADSDEDGIGEIFQLDADHPENVFDPMAHVWTLVETNLVFSGTSNRVVWTDTNVTAEVSNRYYTVGRSWVDTDGDGLNDGRERLLYKTDHLNEDSDGDGMPDGWEIYYGFDPLDDSDASLDPDKDGLTNLEEYEHGTDPHNFDTDGDLLSDWAEINRYGTDPTRWSTPGTATPDWEYKLLAGNSTNHDLRSCGDTPGDCVSITLCGTIPGEYYDFLLFFYDSTFTVHFVVAEAGVLATDTNLTWVDCGGPGRLKPGDDPVGLRFYYAGLADDPDGDGLGSIYECFVLGTSPDLPDTNTNGVPDGDEDFDGDGKSNAAEYNSPAYGYYNPCIRGSSNPWVKDSDNDGVFDGPIMFTNSLAQGPDAFPLDPFGYRDIDCDGLPDGVNTNFVSNSSPVLQLDEDDEPLGWFRVWAPNATSVTVRGEFNGWGESTLTNEGNGHWSGVIANVQTGHQYKFYLSGNLWKQDPLARQIKSQDHNSVVRGTNAFNWTDDSYAPPARNDLVIYQLHIGGFNRVGGSNGTFKTATNLLDYIANLGVNAVKLMPISEFDTASSWGYNPVNPQAIERDYGTPDDFKTLVDSCHAKGLAVILDVVYNHWEGLDDRGGLLKYDGWTNTINPGGIYFYEDPSTQKWLYATQWGPRPNYRRPEVRRYIRNNAMLWLHEYHCDGLRWDATSMIRNYDQTFNDNPTNDIPEGWTLMQQINDDLRAYKTNYIAIAEDLLVNANSRRVTVATSSNGLGFQARWSPFTHPIRNNITNSDPWIAQIKEELEFSYDSDPFDRVIYVESHDEVGALNNKKRFAQQIAESENPGSPDPSIISVQKRAILGAALTFSSPGIPMFFMGQEFLQAGAWSETTALDWSNTNTFSGVVQMHKDVIALRKNVAGTTAGLRGAGLHVNSPVDDSNNILAFSRFDQRGPGDDVMVIANLSGTVWTQSNYEIGFPTSGVWKVRFSSDWQIYNSGFGGIPATNQIDVSAGSQPMHGHPYRAAVNMGAYSFMIYSQDPP